MKNLIVPINEFDFAKLGFDSETISFNDLKEKINIEYAKEALIRCNQIATDTGLSKLKLDEINSEIKAVRDAKNNH